MPSYRVSTSNCCPEWAGREVGKHQCLLKICTLYQVKIINAACLSNEGSLVLPLNEKGCIIHEPVRIFKRQPEPPVAVLHAAYNFFGIAPERAPAVHAEKLAGLTDNLWVIKLNEKSSALVAYVPEDKEQTVTAPWFTE